MNAIGAAIQLGSKSLTSAAPKVLGVNRIGQSFSQVMQGVAGKDLQQGLDQMQSHILDGNKVSHQDLLLYQIQVYRLGMHVELYAKAAEGLSASVRKLQSQ